MIRQGTYDILSPRPGQAYTDYYQDIASIAEYVLETAGAAAAMKYLPELDLVASTRNWRAARHAEVALAIRRTFSTSKYVTLGIQAERVSASP